MKKVVCTTLMFFCAQAYAGGAVGGNPGLMLEALSFNIEALPKTFVDQNAFKRTQLRLSVDGVNTVPMILNGESIDVVNVRGSIVDKDLTKEILAVSGGSTGVNPGAQ
jgi:hypothetical protein